MRSALRTLVLGLVPCLASADDAEVRNTLGASANLPGVQNTLEISWKGPRLTHGIVHSVTPSYSRLGGWVQVSAGPAFDVRAGVEPTLYHGFSGSLVTFDRRGADYDVDARDLLSPRSGLGGRAFLAPAARARVGSLIATLGAELEWWVADTDAPYFYEPSRDTVLRADGAGLLRGAAALLHERKGVGGRRLLVGVNHRAQLGGRHDTHRLGVLAQWTLGERRLGLREPTVVANVFRYLEDPYKQGELGLNVGLRCRLR
jgi:hypothetical protein